MQQSIVLQPPLFHSFALSLCTPLWHSQARPLAGSGRGLKRVLSLLSRLQARTLWSRPAPSRLADSGPGTAQILAVNKELANAAPTQRRTTAKWKVRFLLMFCLFFNALFLGAVGIKKLHEARAPRIMKILICACRKLNSIFSFAHAPKILDKNTRRRRTRRRSRQKEPNDETKRNAAKGKLTHCGVKRSVSRLSPKSPKVLN